MEEKAVRSIPVSLLSYASNKVLTVLTTIVLARLLDPRDFGLFALALIMVALLSMFNDFGLGRVLISRPDLDARAKGTILTSMLAISSTLAVLLVVLSPAVAALFDQPRLAPLLVVIAGTLFLSGPVFFHETLLQRELEFKQQFAASLAQNLVYAGTAISLVLLGRGVLSLVVASVCSYAAYLAMLLAVAPYRVRPAWQPSRLPDLLRSGRGFLVQGGVTFVAQNADNFSVGKLLGSAPLGVYFLAYRLGDLTYSGIAQPVARVTFPGFARMRERGEDWATAYLSALRLIALVAFPVGLVMSAAASPLTEFLYGPKWLAMVGPLTVLGLWAMMRPLEATLTSLLNSVGQADAAAAVNLGGLGVLVPGLWAAAALGGLTTVAWVVVAHAVLMTAVQALVIARRAGVSLGRQSSAVGPLLATAAVSWVATRLVADATAGAGAFLSLAAAGSVALAAYGLLLSVVVPGLLRDALGQGLRTVRRPPVAAS